MKYHVNFQYRPKDAARPQDEPMLDMSGRALDIILTDGGGLPAIGDHVVFCRAGHEGEGQDMKSVTKQVEGVVENRLFFFVASGIAEVNIVVTDSLTDSSTLIKQ